jgi:hypothetical protein
MFQSTFAMMFSSVSLLPEGGWALPGSKPRAVAAAEISLIVDCGSGMAGDGAMRSSFTSS